MPYEEMDGKFYVDHNGSLRTITWKDDDDDDNFVVTGIQTCELFV